MHNRDLRRAVAFVGLANIAYFFVEFGVARHIGSVALFADSVDFLGDAAVNLLIFVALAWSARRRAQVGMALAMLLLVPGIATAWMAWQKVASPVAPVIRCTSSSIGAAFNKWVNRRLALLASPVSKANLATAACR